MILTKQMITGILTAVIIVAATLLVLGTLPMKNTKTGTKFIFQITGKGQQYFFQKDGVNYVVDLTRLAKQGYLTLCQMVACR